MTSTFREDRKANRQAHLRHTSSSRNVIKGRSQSVASITRSKSMWSLGGDSKRRSSIASNEKAKLTHLLKTTQLEQNSKLQHKHHQECELLEDIKNYAKARSEVEKEYGNALLKLTARFQKKELLPTTAEGDGENVPVLAAWKSILDSTEKCAHAHVACSEKYKNNIYEPVKDCRTRKDANLKKCQDVVAALHSEITDSVRFLTKSKKQYFEHENLSQASQEKMQDVKERLQKNNIGIFKSKYDLEKSLQKLEQKCDENEENATVSRNDYLLAIASANAHQKRYFEVDIPQVIRVLDGNVYNQFREFMTSICCTELDMTKTVTDSFTQSNDHACKVSREYDSSLFIQQNAVFEWGPMYTYEKCGSDANDGSLKAENTNDNNSLNREARKTSTRIVRERKQLKRLSKMQEGLQARLTSMKQQQQRISETASLDEAGNKKWTPNNKWNEDNPTSFRLGKVNEDIRKVETLLACSEARLQLLRHTQVDVNSWLKSAELQAENEDRGSKQNNRTQQQQRRQQQNYTTTTTTNTQQQQQEEYDDDNDSFIEDDFCEEDETFEDDDEWDSVTPVSGGGQQRSGGGGHNKSIISTSLYDNISLPSSDKSRNYPISCTVSYPYEATRSDELTIEVGDKIEVVEDGDLDQWVKARDSSGKIGYVPEYYLQFPSPHTTVDDNPMYCEPPGENYTDTLGSSGSTTSGTSSLATQSISSGESNHDIRDHHTNISVVCLARATYEYAACDDEQLSFPEGAIINILAKDDNGVDDGWWKGELNGRVGVFPSIIVEEMGQSSPPQEKLDEPSMACPDETKFHFGTESPPDFKPPCPSSSSRSAPSSPSNSPSCNTSLAPPLPSSKPRSTLPRPQHNNTYHMR